MINIVMVRVLCNVYCEWQGDPPRYRAYVGSELFTERTWIWKDVYLEEAFQIRPVSGKYTIRYELVDKENATLTANNFRIDHGSATVNDQGKLEIL